MYKKAFLARLHLPMSSLFRQANHFRCGRCLLTETFFKIISRKQKGCKNTLFLFLLYLCAVNPKN